MTVTVASQIDELSPRKVYEELGQNAEAVLVDVRTKAEWSFVGVPDLSALGQRVLTIEWLCFPSMQPNPSFTNTLLEMAGGAFPERIYFICRSGARSMSAAQQVAAAANAIGQGVHCTNVAEGFEGDLDEERHRGTMNGWKAHGLPWRQN